MRRTIEDAVLDYLQHNKNSRKEFKGTFTELALRVKMSAVSQDVREALLNLRDERVLTIQHWNGDYFEVAMLT